MRPFLKWPGGKQAVLDQMRPFFPKVFNTYFEPFLGGGAVFFDIRPKKAIISDLNPDLIMAFLRVRSDLSDLLEELNDLQDLVTEEDYYAIRAKNPLNMTAVERAARTVYLNKTCYNGLWRVNKQGQFNVPWGKKEGTRLYDPGVMNSCSRALQSTLIMVADFRKMIRFASHGDLIYFDPPYIPISETSSFVDFTIGGFDEEDQMELAELARDLVNEGVLVMASNSNSDLARELWQGFTVHKIITRRAISCGDRPEISELFFTSW